MRDPAHAGTLRNRVTFLAPSLDANGDPEGPIAALFTVWAQVESDPGPTHVQGQRLEADAVICITLRSSSQARTLVANMFASWTRYPGRLYQLRAPSEDPRRMWITVYADAYAGGAGG